MNITYKSACLHKLGVIAPLLALSTYLFWGETQHEGAVPITSERTQSIVIDLDPHIPAQIPYSNSLFILPQAEGYLHYAPAPSRERARNMVVP